MGHRGRGAAARRPLRLAAACALTLALHPMLAVAGAQGRGRPAPAAPPRDIHAAHVSEAARRFGIPENWIWRVMHVESGGNPRAVSRAGAMGLMQIMPATWAMLSARHGLGSDPFDSRANILAGAAYLRAMWDRYRNISLMLIAYNAGPGRADAYAAGRRALPSETLAYAARLAPAMGRAIERPLPAARKEPPSWRDASLFALKPDPPREEGDGHEMPALLVPPDPVFAPTSSSEP